eukprot:scaffold8378_cov113-Isochrysis_galbana.AAC.8
MAGLSTSENEERSTELQRARAWSQAQRACRQRCRASSGNGWLSGPGSEQQSPWLLVHALQQGRAAQHGR